jgi:hypothetical protein
MAKIRITMKIARKREPLTKAPPAGLNRAADFLVGELRKAVSVQNPYHGNRHNKDAGKPPFKRIGAGMDSIHRTATGRISMLAYMALLDIGTKRIEPRPWYRVTIDRVKATLARLALGK